MAAAVFNAEDKTTETAFASGTGLVDRHKTIGVRATPPVRARDPILLLVENKVAGVATAEHTFLACAIVTGGVKSAHATIAATTN
jgi:hypothetical protein